MFSVYQCKRCGKKVSGNNFYLEQTRFGKYYDQWYKKLHCGTPIIKTEEHLDMQRVRVRNPETNEITETNELVPRTTPFQLRKNRARLTNRDISDMADKTRERRKLRLPNWNK